MARGRRRTTKRKTRRARPKPSVLGLVEGVVIGSAVTKGFFGVDLVPWLTEGWLVAQTSATNNSSELSLAEMVKGIIPGGEGAGITAGPNWPGGTIGEVIQHNLKNQGGMMIATLIIAPIGFRFLKRGLSKPLRLVNTQMKRAGLPFKV